MCCLRRWAFSTQMAQLPGINSFLGSTVPSLMVVLIASNSFPFPNPPVLQLRGAREGDSVLPPGRSLISLAADGPRGFGCDGDRRTFPRWCRLGPSRSRVCFPGSSGEVAAVELPWNKSLRPHPHFAGVCSVAAEGSVREGSTGSGLLAAAGTCPSLGDLFVGGGSMVLWASTGPNRRVAAGSVVAWWAGSSFFLAGRRRCARARGQGDTGCVPGRRAFKVCFSCGSYESLCAMVLPLAVVFLLFFSFRGDAPAIDGEEERRTTVAVGTQESLDFLVIFCFFRVFCAKVSGQLSLLYCSSIILYLYGLVCVLHSV